MEASQKDCVAVIDIGSNSIRLIIYDSLCRECLPLFNEKVICGLGRDLGTSGRLSPDGMALARPNLRRFVRLARTVGVAKINTLATAALREAEDGAAFAQELERELDLPIDVISGAEEARLSGLGVASAFYGARGLMGDLGGGSLELVELADGVPRRAVTLPLGALRLAGRAGGARARMVEIVEESLDDVPWLSDIGPDKLYTVGGAWRALAHLDIEQSGYPLHLVHGYSMTRARALALTGIVDRLGAKSLAGIESISAQRLATLPAAALVLQKLLERLRCRDVVTCSLGLREGLLYDQMSAQERARDPLLAAAAKLGAQGPRFGDIDADLMAWCGPLFPEETPQEKRLRNAVALLSDICLREHADFRGRQAVNQVMHHPFICLSHEERAFIAFSLFLRYRGAKSDPVVEPVKRLLPQPLRQRAKVLGMALALAYRISAGLPSLLQESTLSWEGETLVLNLPGYDTAPSGDAVERQFAQLRKVLGEVPGTITH